MNWEAIGALGEIIGALAVVASLLFVGVQVRRTNLDAKARASELWTVNYRDLLFNAASNSDEISRGYRSFSKLNDGEKMQFHIWMSAHIQDAQNQHRQLKYGSQDFEAVDGILNFNAMLLKLTGPYEWWQYSRQIWDADFVAEMEARITDATPLDAVFPWFSGSDT